MLRKLYLERHKLNLNILYPDLSSHELVEHRFEEFLKRGFPSRLLFRVSFFAPHCLVYTQAKVGFETSNS
jgi:hypothetical protein